MPHLYCSPTAADETESSTVKHSLPKPGVCGTNLADRILGGNKTALNAYPWTALLVTEPRTGGSESFGCGGSLISDWFVLTAGHCFRELPDWAHVVRVRLGEWDLESDPDCNDENICNDKHLDVNVGSYVVHEDYDSKNLHNDVALIKLAKVVSFTEYISPVCLPLAENLRNQSERGKIFTVIGWGTTERGQEAPGVYGSRYKLEVEVPGVDLGTCRESYPQLLDSEMCAGGETGKDSCQGDSGGCLVAPETDGYWYQYGVVSWGYGCGSEGLPGVYARVISFMDWIEENMK
ncbi:AAEL006568-PB [Aedes aegypti]|uniref:limulus clotting factor C n=1 Tax=Aedes aegypti TaxID=7159 RepID=Q175R9_AEDAE|nr:AAEL006568-PB [Aedes aegypti]